MSIINITVVKERPDTEIGIAFRLVGDAMLIESIAPTSLFANTELTSGMEIVKINGVFTDCLSSKQVQKILQDTTGEITLEVCTANNLVEGESDSATAGQPLEPYNHTESYTNPDITTATRTPVVAEPCGGNSADADGSIPVIASAQIMTHSLRELSVTSVDACPVMEYPTTAIASHQNRQGCVVQRDTIDDHGIVSVTSTKPSPDSNTGIGLIHKRGVGVCISSFKTFSIFNGTHLRVGMKILRINGTDCSQDDSAQNCALLLRSSVRDVTIVATHNYVDAGESNSFATSTTTSTTRAAARTGTAGMATATATALQPAEFPITTAIISKPTQHAKVGLGVVDETLSDGSKVPVITNIASDGLCCNTPLQLGMRVLSINSISCRGRDDTIAMLRVIPEGSVTIVAGPLNMVAATVTKSNRDAKVGLIMGRNLSGRLVVSRLPQGGLFSKTDLKEGMQIFRINNVDVQSLELAEISAIISRSEVYVTVLAKTRNTTMSSLSATAAVNRVVPGSAAAGAPPSDAAGEANTKSGVGCLFCIGASALFCLVGAFV